MANFIVCPDGTTYQNDRVPAVPAASLGGRPFIADSAEDALHLAYAEGYARFPALKYRPGTMAGGEWSALRDRRIMAAARRVVMTRGLKFFNRAAIAAEANTKPATINNFGRTVYSENYNPTDGYRERILSGLMAEAIDKADIAIIRVGIADGCLRGEDVPIGLRAAVGL